MKQKKAYLFALCATTLLSGCSAPGSDSGLTYTDTLYDTVISIQILDDASESVLDGCKELCIDFDEKFSYTNENSEIYQINHADGEPVEVSDDTITLLKEGIRYSELSDGSFDLTIGAVSELWDFHAKNPRVPDDAAVREAVSHVDYRNIQISGNQVSLADPKAAIDVGAIAKGYIADRLKDYLTGQGVKNALINLGGNVLAMGNKTDGSKYNIGIQKPFDKSGQPVTSVRIAGQSVVTTGTYQRYFMQNNRLYHHVLDPRTGYPCENNLSSVTIITDSSLTADALSTTCFLLGYEKGTELAESLGGVETIFITNENEILR